jgi:hypothetical protein
MDCKAKGKLKAELEKSGVGIQGIQINNLFPNQGVRQGRKPPPKTKGKRGLGVPMT